MHSRGFISQKIKQYLWKQFIGSNIGRLRLLQPSFWNLYRQWGDQDAGGRHLLETKLWRQVNGNFCIGTSSEDSLKGQVRTRNPRHLGVSLLQSSPILMRAHFRFWLCLCPTRYIGVTREEATGCSLQSQALFQCTKEVSNGAVINRREQSLLQILLLEDVSSFGSNTQTHTPHESLSYTYELVHEIHNMDR